MTRIAPDIPIDENEIQFESIKASGPGGQKVNKAATAVQLRFDLGKSSLPDNVLRRLIRLGGKRVSRNGIFVIDARRFRTREMNRKDALERLIKLVIKAYLEPKARRRTKPSMASRRKRVEEKRYRGMRKKMRQAVRPSKD
jgi:ribosome-associated protein